MGIRFSNVIGSIAVFIFAVMFAYYTYPFFQSLLTALDGLSIWDGWETISGIFWVGYYGLLVLLIFGAPYYTLMRVPEGQ